jgi:hypothetical protein
VKTQSSFWTSDDGVCGRRNLLGGVVFRDIILLIGMVGLLFAVASSRDEVFYRLPCVKGVVYFKSRRRLSCW